MPEVAAVITATFPFSFAISIPPIACLFFPARLLAQAAGGQELFAGEPGGVVGGQECGDGSDVFGLSGATQRRLADQFFLPVRTDEAGAHGAFGLDDAGVDGVHADLLWSEFAGENAGDSVDRAFGAGVHRAVRRRDAADAGADVDNAGAFFKAAWVVSRRPRTLMLNSLWNDSTVMVSMGENS